MDNPKVNIRKTETVKKLHDVHLKASDGIQAFINTGHPNFVLVQGSRQSANSAVFSDLVPTHVGLTQVIVSSKESLVKFIMSSRYFIVCLLSIVSKIINSTIYQSYLAMVSGYDQVQALPSRYKRTKTAFSNFIKTISNEQARHLWWLEVRLETRAIIKKAESLFSVFLRIIKKIYLSIIIIASLGFLAFASVFTTSSETNSILQNTVQAESFVDETKVNLETGASSNSIFAVNPLETEAKTVIQTIVKHVTEDGDTIESISMLYGLEQDTVTFNNSIEFDQDGDIIEGQNIYLPWADGYIYSAAKDVSVKDLTRIYHTTTERIVSENPDILNSVNDTVKAGSLLLIPLDNYDVIVKYNKNESDRLKRLEAENIRKRALANRSISNNCTFSNSLKIDAGFIWPTKGHCSQGYGVTPFSYVYTNNFHPGVDIANNYGTVLSSVHSGRVVMARYGNGGACLGSKCFDGYGNVVVVEHEEGYTTVYGHMSTISVKTGDYVRQGQQLGLMGSTGFSTGNHLHFEVWLNGIRQNPFQYLP